MINYGTENDIGVDRIFINNLTVYKIMCGISNKKEKTFDCRSPGLSDVAPFFKIVWFRFYYNYQIKCLDTIFKSGIRAQLDSDVFTSDSLELIYPILNDFRLNTF